MDMLLNCRGLILHISPSIILIEDGLWKASENRYFADDNYEVATIDEVPIEVTPMKYYYVNGEFKLNPDYQEEGADTKTIQELREQLEELTLEQAEAELDVDERLCNLELGLA